MNYYCLKITPFLFQIEMDFALMFQNNISILDEWSNNYIKILSFLAAENRI